ncbi:thioredoxin family protein [Martelella sp. AD-3]|uniref:thioredoxin family protein n=1 Tax=Martelella sp. AD-3 TaxID=686597 RepID=UPI000467950E|nr:thioredoxin family protein [Martelella sp. AD-3]AMM86022.1 glutaredoxin [Martelella sp. AD-3]MAM11471.1 thioredoxin family protein [Rhizobiaceae bacterium]|tara:strand:+ start:123 stop:359 length:237 start_codon:yes stop_codon:yes gene_type:complete
MKSIRIYGPGCKRCETTEAMVKDAAEKLGIAAEIEKVSDPRAIALAGVMSTPGISIDGKLVHTGGLPDKAKLEAWLSA